MVQIHRKSEHSKRISGRFFWRVKRAAMLTLWPQLLQEVLHEPKCGSKSLESGCGLIPTDQLRKWLRADSATLFCHHDSYLTGGCEKTTKALRMASPITSMCDYDDEFDDSDCDSSSESLDIYGPDDTIESDWEDEGMTDSETNDEW